MQAKYKRQIPNAAATDVGTILHVCSSKLVADATVTRLQVFGWMDAKILGSCCLTDTSEVALRPDHVFPPPTDHSYVLKKRKQVIDAETSE